MGQKFRSGDSPDQVMLMPADPREWLPPGHLAWKVLDLAGEMDLSRFGASYRPDGQGGRPYHPQMMATLLLYCYCRGRKSSREIEMATFDDVGARVICGGLHPGHSTVAEFVRRNMDAVLALLPESVKACAAEGLVSLELVAGDGTKLKANAAMAANLTREQLDAQISELETWIDAEFRQWAREFLDAEGSTAPAGAGAASRDGGDGPGDGSDSRGKRKWKKKPDRAAQMLERRLAARARLDALQDKDQGKLGARIAELAARIGRKEAAVRKWEKAAAGRLEARARKTAAGQRIGGRRPIASPGEDRDVKRARQALDKTRADYQAACREAAAPAADPKAKVNPTDPSSLVMPLKKGGFDQLFNIQALATARTQVILAIMRHPSPVDAQALLPLLDEARRVLDAAGITGQILKALFDAGYASDASFTAGIPETLYVAVTREGRQTGRSQDGRDPQSQLPSWQDMTARLDTPEGRKLYRQRSATIEPVFAQLTARLSRTLHYRGNLADAELALWAASHNILKAITARSKRLARQARTAPAPAPALAA
jgi:transposase